MALLSSCRCVSCTRRHGDIFASEGPRRPFPAPDRRGRQLPRHLLAAPRYVRAASARTRCQCACSCRGRLLAACPAIGSAHGRCSRRPPVRMPPVPHSARSSPTRRILCHRTANSNRQHSSPSRPLVWAPGSRVRPWRQALSAVAAPGVGCGRAGGGPRLHRGQPCRHGRVRGAVMVARRHRERRTAPIEKLV